MVEIEERSCKSDVQVIGPDFQGCLGALDGTYISIRVEAIYKPRYRTRKGDIATNVLGVSDRNLKFIYVLPGWEGSTADGCVLRDVVVRTNGLKLPQNNGTFRHGYLMELEHYMNARHPNCGLKSLPHVDSKIRAWKESYATISLLKSRSGLGFQYSDGNDASGTRDDQAAQEEPNVSTGATQSPFTAQDEPNESTGAAQSSFTTQKSETRQSQKQGDSFKASSSKVNEKGRCKKRKTTEDDNDIVLKGERDLSEIRGKVLSIIGSPAFEIYNSDERVKATMGITQDIKRMEFFLSINELEHHNNSAVGEITKIQLEIRSTQMLFCQVIIYCWGCRSGLGFRYNDGTILVEDPKAWDDFIKVDPYTKSMKFKKWPLFTDWEEIFRKDGATEQFAEGPEVGVQEIERIEAQEVSNDMSFEFPIIVIDEDDAPAKKEDQIAQGEPSVSDGATQSSWSAF
ncbi:hypothetical protein H5410_061934 [Solanum commersonii]|uniref:DDE Tnp4 domain-containing protein n=1 Tax=Solanum commersonii TaxID=4109 RepID=A0A9J5WAQ3_SOLCO|nr:hypothetical protein H5410_061934 [Solanum commersonii]